MESAETESADRLTGGVGKLSREAEAGRHYNISSHGSLRRQTSDWRPSETHTDSQTLSRTFQEHNGDGYGKVVRW